MSAPARVTTFVAGQKIYAADMNAELNQIIAWLSGSVSTQEFTFKSNSGGTPPLTLDQVNTNGPILQGKINSVLQMEIEKEGHIRQKYNDAYFGTVPLMINLNQSQVSDSGTSETDLYSCEIRGNSLKVDGDTLRLTGWGVLAATTGKVIRVKFGGTTLFDSSAFVANLTDSVGWNVEMCMMRTASNIATYFARLCLGTNIVYNTAGNMTEDLTVQKFLRITGQDTNAAVGITKYAAIVERYVNR